MSGYITFWSKDYLKQIQRHKDTGPLRVVYGSSHIKMPSIAALKVGDIVYPVAIQDKTLCVMARLQIERIEPAYDYLMRETGFYYSALIPEGVLVKSQGPYGEFNRFKGGSGYTDNAELPASVHTVVYEENLKRKPHHFHQEPITCCADTAASGEGGSSIEARPIPLERVSTFLFGKSKSTQKPLRLDKNGNLTSLSLSGFVRKMSDETFRFFEEMFV